MDFVGEKIYKCGDSLSKIYKCGEVVWEKENPGPGPGPDYSAMPITFEFLDSGSLRIQNKDSETFPSSLQYCINGLDWTYAYDGPSTEEGRVLDLPVSSGDIIELKGEWLYNIIVFTNTETPYRVYGNIMSLADSEVFGDLDYFPGGDTEAAFSNLFYESTGLVDAENLILPVTRLTDSCYRQMFYGCTELTVGPKLPATTLANNCYESMFYECRALETAPEISGTDLEEGYNCCGHMFAGCTNMTTAPEILPATTLAEECYNHMFEECTSLTTGPELPATRLDYSCYEGMFRGCTDLTTAPELPATTLAERSYHSMFEECTSLNYIKCLATDFSADSSIKWWVSGVSPTGTFVKKAGVEWPTGINGIPSGWTVIEE